MPFNIIDVQAGQAASLLKGSSWLIYNGVLLTEVLTEGYEMEEVRSEDGAQRIAIKHTLKILAILNPQVNSFIVTGADSPPPRSTVTAAAMPSNINIVRDYLLQERKLLQYAVGGTVTVESPQMHSTAEPPLFRNSCDSFMGPKPLYCQITQITGASSFYVRFGIEAWTDPCTTYSGPLYFLQSHRWSMAHDVDGDTWLTTRMVTGHLKFRPESLGTDPTIEMAFPDQTMRAEGSTWMHPIPDGFKRQNVKLQALPNGMEMAYSFVDVEQPLPLGSLSPATKLSAEFSIASGLFEGKPATTQAAVHVAALGPKNHPRMNLLVQAMRIALRKLQKPGLTLIREVAVHYSLDNKYVDLSISAIWKPVGLGMEGLQLADTGLKAQDDMADLDAALSIFRENGEALQGTQSNRAKAPAPPFEGRNGTYYGICVGSSLVNGCYDPRIQPKNYLLTVSNNKGAEFVPGDPTSPLPGGLNPLDFAPFSLTLTPVLTIALLSTGLSAELVNSTGLYEEWYMATRYYTHHQKAVMPVGRAQITSPGDRPYTGPQVATLGEPYTLKTQDWTVAWIGPYPTGMILPSPDTGDTNDVLIAEDISPATPTVVSAGMKSWRVSGTYWYISKRMRSASATAVAQFTSPGVDQGFSPGKSITDPASRATNTIGLSRFIAGYSPSFVG